jgi:hypothetical protein
MKGIDRLIQQARVVAGIRRDDLDNYDFERLSTDEIKELICGNITDERFYELAGKARKELEDEKAKEESEKE